MTTAEKKDCLSPVPDINEDGMEKGKKHLAEIMSKINIKEL